MGTNYYFNPAVKPCETCGHLAPGGERLHIGKSSAGWVFSLHVIPELRINSFTDWKEYILGTPGLIVDEYGTNISFNELFDEVIANRQWAFYDSKDDEAYWRKKFLDHALRGSYSGEGCFHRLNHSKRGPNGLLRHQIRSDGFGCIAHGEGTWDLIVGDFS